MWTLRFFLTFALLFAFSDAHGCKDPELANNFSWDQIVGVWYEVEGTQLYPPKCASYTVEVDKGNKAKWGALKKYVNTETGKEESVYLKVKTLDHAAKLRATPPKGDTLLPYTFSFVHFDDSCTIVHLCHEDRHYHWDDVFIAARKTELTDEERMACHNIVKQKQLDGQELHKYLHDCKKKTEEL